MRGRISGWGWGGGGRWCGFLEGGSGRGSCCDFFFGLFVSFVGVWGELGSAVGVGWGARGFSSSDRSRGIDGRVMNTLAWVGGTVGVAFRLGI